MNKKAKKQVNDSEKRQNINLNTEIPFGTGKPDRCLIITPDEILDLQIVLNTTKTVDGFLDQM